MYSDNFTVKYKQEYNAFSYYVLLTQLNFVVLKEIQNFYFV